MGSAERLVRACLRGGWNKVVKNVEGKAEAEAVRQESERARARKVIGKEKEGEREGKTDRLREEEREYREPGAVVAARESLWCGGAWGSASATRFESQRSEALRLQNGVKTQ